MDEVEAAAVAAMADVFGRNCLESTATVSPLVTDRSVSLVQVQLLQGLSPADRVE